MAPTRSPELDRLKRATQQVEAIFIKDLLAQMRRGFAGQKDKDPMGEMARDMMDQAVADDFSRTGSLGIGKLLYKNLAEAYQRQEAAKEAAKEEGP